MGGSDLIGGLSASCYTIDDAERFADDARNGPISALINDALPHEAWNESSAERIVLVVDLWHPDLTAEEIELLSGLQSYAYANAENLAKYWKSNGTAREAARATA